MPCFWVIMESQQIFHQFQFYDFLHFPNKKSKQNPLTILHALKVTKGKPIPP